MTVDRDVGPVIPLRKKCGLRTGITVRIVARAAPFVSAWA